MLEAFGQDLRTALRSLSHRRGPGLAAVATLALGIGATTVLLGTVDQVLLRPLAYGQAGELYSVWGVTDRFDRVQPSYPDFRDWRESARSVELAFAYGDVFALRGDEGVEQVSGSAVSPGFFDVLATPPALGRTFAPDEEREGVPVVVLSYGYWRAGWGGDRAVVGRVLELNGVPHTVIGVMPQGFEWPEWSELWIPLAEVQQAVPGLRQRDARVDARALARLREGASVAAAESELRAVAARLAEAHPETNEGLSLRLSPLRDDVVGEVRGSLVLMVAAGVLVLLLACANVAAILLGRGLDRARELAVRRALGADRRRLVRQLVAENVLLAGIGGILGTVLAVATIRLVGRSAVAAGAARALPLPRLTELGVDGGLLAMAVGVTAAATLLFGVAPAISATAADPALRLREGGRGGSGRHAIRGQSALSVAQLAIAVALMTGAALLVRTLDELRRTDAGFEPERLVVLRVFPPESYATGDARLGLYDRLADRLRAVPGVAGVGLINHMPFAGGRVDTRIGPAGLPVDSAVGARYRTSSPGFFEVVGTPILRGRDFSPGEAGADRVVLSESLAETLFPGADPVGRSVGLANPTPPSPRRGETFEARVVGVVGDVRDAPRQEPIPTVYVPHARDPWGNIFVVARAGAAPATIVSGFRRAVTDVDPSIPVAETEPLSERARGYTSRERVFGRVMVGFAALALVLSAVGIYGALSNGVRRRLRELGIRMALGARPADVRRLVMRRALWIVLPGVALGALGGLALGRVMEGLLFGVVPGDAGSLLAAAALLGSIGLLAGWLPARTAGRADPTELLNVE